MSIALRPILSSSHLCSWASSSSSNVNLESKAGVCSGARKNDLDLVDLDSEGEGEGLKGREKRKWLGEGRMTVRMTVWVGCSKVSVIVTVPGKRGNFVGLGEGEISGEEPSLLKLDAPWLSPERM